MAKPVVKKQPQVVQHCARGHALYAAKLIPSRGRARMIITCECQYAPMSLKNG